SSSKTYTGTTPAAPAAATNASWSWVRKSHAVKYTTATSSEPSWGSCRTETLGSGGSAQKAVMLTPARPLLRRFLGWVSQGLLLPRRGAAEHREERVPPMPLELMPPLVLMPVLRARCVSC
ncbi:unnamed protein product, partial [Ectocarpus sp. 12 AP-2014]